MLDAFVRKVNDIKNISVASFDHSAHPARLNK